MTGTVIMSLTIGHHVWSHMGLSCPLQSFVGKFPENDSVFAPVKHKSKNSPTIAEIIHNSSIRQRLHRRRDWRERVVRGGADVSEQTKDHKSSCENNVSHLKSLSSKQFTNWDLAWHLSMAESRIAHIEAEVHDARIIIGNEAGRISDLELRSTLHLRDGGRFFEDNISRASESLRTELTKLLRHLNVLQKSSAQLREQLKKPTLEKNLIVQQILREHLSAHVNVTSPLYAVGNAIRNRYLENATYHSRNKDIVLAGNEAAHNGDALADAILYHPSKANHRKDSSTYSEIYGLPPFTVWIHQNCKPYLKMVTWYGTVKRWHPHDFAYTPFAKAWPADFFQKYSKPRPEVFQADFANGKFTSIIKVLEEKYATEAIDNRRKYQ